MRAQVEPLGLAGQPGCLQGGVGRSQGASAEVVEMAWLRRELDFVFLCLRLPAALLLGSTIARSQLNALEF